ncbi:triose-phosphate isomerase [Candidatus Parcubacteria bacterium]|jgi:triosephosphate isomerase (TIM)|nr:triose-phosphate isomerase [Candidatus Parcubacteria bacterium]
MDKSFEKIIIANWKMQLTVDQAVEEAKELKSLVKKNKIDKETKVVVCPSFLSMSEVSKVFKTPDVLLGAQDTYPGDSGAHTGEVSLKNLQILGCQFVILGHSERRAMGETDASINAKVKAVLEHDMVPIICVGETYDERKEEKTNFVVIHQVYEALKDVKIKEGQQIILAYEPVWVIGSGQVIDDKEADRMSDIVYQSFVDAMNGEHLSSLNIIYGGSVTPDTVSRFTNLKNIKGVLVGGASLDGKVFAELVKNA